MDRVRQLERGVIRWIDALSKLFGYVAATILLLMTLLITYDVVARYLFNRPTPWADDISGYMLVAIVYAGLAYTLLTEGHIRVDFLLNRLAPRAQRKAKVVTDIFAFIILAIITWQGYTLVLRTYTSYDISFSILRVPVYITQIAIPVGLTVFCLAILVQVYKEWREPSDVHK